MKLARMLSAAIVLAVMAVPAEAGFKLMPASKPVAVGKAGLMVTPAADWNRLGAKIGRFAEAWTLDGHSLNDLTFYAGIEEDRTLFREVDKKNRPLPRFTASMLPPDIAQLFESSYRIAVSTSLFTIDSIEPAQFAGRDGFRFSYSFTIQNEEVRRKGEATGAIIGGRLYLIAFEAPAIHYFDRDVEAYRAVVASARVGSAGKS